MTPPTSAPAATALHCWVCGNDVERFLNYGIPARPGKCPHCGAKPRYRAVIWCLRRLLTPRFDDCARVLEVGASAISAKFYPRPENLGEASYTVIDTRQLLHHELLRRPHQFVHGDITNNNLPDDHYDLVLCNNTLPYVPDYRLALGEIRRVLKATGIAMLNTHWQAGPTLTAVEHRRRNPDLTAAYYAENGDQWVFGEDFLKQVRKAGFEFRAWEPYRRLAESCLVRNGLKRDTVLVLGWKTPGVEKTLCTALERLADPTLKSVAEPSAGSHSSSRNGALFPAVTHL